MPAVVPLVVGAAVATGTAAAIGTAIAGAAISTAVATGIGAAVVGAGTALATGQKPEDALKTAVVSGLTAGIGSSLGAAASGAGTMTDAAFVAADAAQLAGQGLSQAAIAQNLTFAGVNSAAAASAASLAAAGLTEAAISSSLGSGTLFNSPLQQVAASAPSDFGGYGVQEVGVDIDAFGSPIDAGAGTNPYVSDFGGAPAAGPTITPVSYTPPFEQIIAPRMGDLASGISYQGDLSLDPGIVAPQVPTVASPGYFDPYTDPRSFVSGRDLTIADPMGDLPKGISYQGDTSLGPQTFIEPPSYLPADSLYEMGIDNFAPGETLPPRAIYEGEYFDPYTDPRSFVSGRDVTTNMFEGDLTPDPYAYRGDASMLTAGEVGAPKGLPHSYFDAMAPVDYSLQPPPNKTMMGAESPGFRFPTMTDLTSPGYYKDMGMAALNLVKDNPWTALQAGALLAGAVTGKPEQLPPPQRRPNESDARFAERLKRYEYLRSQLDVGDISQYAYGPQKRFFTDAVYRPIEPVAPVQGAAMGGLMSVNPDYYTYGSPVGMANGGQVSDDDIRGFLERPNLSDRDITDAMLRHNVSAKRMAEITGVPIGEIHRRIDAADPSHWLKTPSMQEYLANEVTGTYKDQGFDVSQISDIQPWMSINLANQGALQFVDEGRRGEAQRMQQAINQEKFNQAKQHYEQFGEQFVPVGYTPSVRQAVNTGYRDPDAGYDPNFGYADLGFSVDASSIGRSGLGGGFRQFTPEMASYVDRLVENPDLARIAIPEQFTGRLGFTPTEVVDYLKAKYPQSYGELTPEQYMTGGGSAAMRPFLQQGYEAQGLMSSDITNGAYGAGVTPIEEIGNASAAAAVPTQQNVAGQLLNVPYSGRSRVDNIQDISNYGYGPQARFFRRAANGGRMIKSPLAFGGIADGRSDDVPAVLSDGEYVIDAETVALLGNGSVDAGAAQLDRMREEIRRHKGKSLAAGKISPNARGALSYMKG
jgi:hypothetical protein